MISNVTPAVNLCPINFNQFSLLQNKTKNLDATVLCSKLKFHQLNSKIKYNGKTWIVRSREQIAEWFHYSTKKVDKIIDSLSSMGLLEKRVSTWYGKKRLFLNVPNEIDAVPINNKLLSILLELSGSLHAALIFSKIMFAFTNTTIHHEQKKWCCLKKKDLSDWSGLSLRTIDPIIEQLSKKGCLLKQLFLRHDRLQSHFHIPHFVLQTIKDKFERHTTPQPKPATSAPNFSEPGNPTDLWITSDKKVIHTQNCRYTPAKKGLFIKVRTNLKKTNNNTPEKKTISAPTNGAIIFDNIDHALSLRQQKYLFSAMNRTVQRSKLSISEPEALKEEIKFSVLNQAQHKGITSFRHRVSRCMKILSENNWKTPIGFIKHSKEGQKIHRLRQQKTDEWKKIKADARQNALNHLHSNKNNALTDKALLIAAQVVRLSHRLQSEKHTSLSKLIEKLLGELHQLVSQGAQKSKITQYFRDHAEQSP